MAGLFSSTGSGAAESQSGNPSQRSRTSSTPTFQQLDREIALMICEFGEPAFFAALGRAVESLSAKDVPLSEIAWEADLGWINIPDAVVDDWARRFPGVDIRAQLSQAHGWLLANPRNRKKRYRRFLESWFRRSQKASRAYNQGHTAGGDTRGF